jgi:hypothetical protein
MSKTQRQLIFSPRPGAPLGPELFELRESPLPRPDSGQVLIRNLVLSCDPAQVGWLMGGNHYAPKIAVGEVMRAWGAGHVISSKHPSFKVGDRVWGTLGWQEYALSDGSGVLPLQHIPQDIPLSVPLGVGGINGITAHIGLVDLCATRTTDQVVVSSAAGATGSAALQIAQNLGARVIGIAGGPRKAAFVRDILGAVECVDYKAGGVAERVRELCPAGVDVYFDNVGGTTLDVLLGAMADNGRIALCGASAQYAGESLSGAQLHQVLARTLRVQGFVLYQHADRYRVIAAQLCDWVRSGRLQAYEDLAYGLEAAPGALMRLFQGLNVGKQLVVLEGAAGLESNLTAARAEWY